MHSLLPLLTLLATTTAASTPKTLYATHHPNTLYTLSLTTNETNNDPAQSLAITSAKNTCGELPGWLTLDRSSGVLYCSDGSVGSGNETLSGSVTALATKGEGLEELAKVRDVGAGVSSGFYPVDDGEVLAVAHEYVFFFLNYLPAQSGILTVYSTTTPALTTFPLPLYKNQQPLQTIHYNRTSQVNQVLPEPSGRFLVVPDLGLGLLHVHTVDPMNGVLSDCESLDASGHAAFGSAGEVLYTVSEDGELSVFKVGYEDQIRNYGQACPTFEKTQTIKPDYHPESEHTTTTTKTTASSIQIRDNTIYITLSGTPHPYASIESDAVATFLINPDGTVTFHNLTPSYGKGPQMVDVSEDGQLVVIANEQSASVVVVKRLDGGVLGEAVGRLIVGGEGELGSVVWG